MIMTADRIFCNAEEAKLASGRADRVAQVVKLTKNHRLLVEPCKSRIRLDCCNSLRRTFFQANRINLMQN